MEIEFDGRLIVRGNMKLAKGKDGVVPVTIILWEAPDGFLWSSIRWVHNGIGTDAFSASLEGFAETLRTRFDGQLQKETKDGD